MLILDRIINGSTLTLYSGPLPVQRGLISDLVKFVCERQGVDWRQLAVFDPINAVPIDWNDCVDPFRQYRCIIYEVSQSVQPSTDSSPSPSEPVYHEMQSIQQEVVIQEEEEIDQNAILTVDAHAEEEAEHVLDSKVSPSSFSIKEDVKLRVKAESMRSGPFEGENKVEKKMRSCASLAISAYQLK
ncbi:hypothetical protein PFISCL1PPCAC_21204, partial [Pristionchus fissidentatus]